jgi:MFS family permease
MLDSHLFLIINNKDESLNRLKYFRNEKNEDLDLEHDTFQSYLIKEEQRKLNFFGHHNILTLLVIIMVQNSYISVFNALHNYLRLIFMKSFLMEWTETVALSARMFGNLTSFLILDCVPKKFHFTIPSGIVSLLLITFGALIIFFSQLWLPLIFFIILEFFLGLGMGGISDILKSELFPIKERWISMSVAHFFEEGLQIISLVILYSWAFGLGSNPTYWPFIFAAILLPCSLMVFFVLKDSRKEHLIDACMLYSE